MTYRHVVSVFASRQDTALSRILAESGWRVEPLDVLKQQPMMQAASTCAIGIVHVNGAAAEWLKKLQWTIEHLRHVTWIAIIDRTLLSDERLREFIAVNCVDYQTTPLERERLLFILGHAAGMAALSGQRDAGRSEPGNPMLVGRSPVMQQLRRDIGKVAAADAPVLITGESGTGKELVARSIHELSTRRGQPFIAINCASVSPTLVHAELFGFERGAFTGAHRSKAGHFELAHGGTILLDEIGDLHIDMQALLLRLLEERTVRRVGSEAQIAVDVRVLAATNLDLEAAVEQGRFREDLYYRLNVLRINTPPLRDHPQDVDALAYAFLRQFAGEQRGSFVSFTRPALAAMCAHRWPGNVRELLNRVRRALVMCEGRAITAGDLGFEPTLEARNLDLKGAILAVERRTIMEALHRSEGNAHQSARMMGVSRATLYRLLEKHGLLPKSIHLWGGFSLSTWLCDMSLEIAEAVECVACVI